MDKQENLIILDKPKLRNPHMICGIGGWVDGGEAATGSVKYLIRKLDAKKFAEIPINKFHIFQLPGQNSLRPHVKLENGILKEHNFPQNQFFYWINPNADNDLVLFLGTEPNLYWEEYINTIFKLADEFSINRTYILGGVLDKTPHTREPGASCACSTEELKHEMQNYSLQFSNYEGPGSFSTTFLHMCQNKNRKLISITARATYYPEYNIVIPHNPKTIRTVIRRLNHLLHMNLNISDLDEQVKEFESKLNFMVSQNAQFRTYIEELEKDFIEVKYEEPLEISAAEAVQIAEEFLKGKGED
ncbi:MAG: PAC2 family protein [Dehalococcoidales bacterium]|nr:PAC2 family protein [Dehalococcoidales bacterium]